jgi:hypothetical protein
MPYNSTIRPTLQSFGPEGRLVRNGNYDALRFKYQARLDGGSERRESLRCRAAWRTMPVDRTIEFRQNKFFGHLLVEAGTPFAALGYDGNNGVVLQCGQPGVLELHAVGVAGVQAIRHELAMAAEYIQEYKYLRTAVYVGSVTHRQMARLASGLGFNTMPVERFASERHEQRVRAASMAYHALAGRPDVFEPRIVYLPVPEFVERFQSSESLLQRFE